MFGTIEILLETETVIGINKNSKDFLKILQLSRETPTPSCQHWDIMA